MPTDVQTSVYTHIVFWLHLCSVPMYMYVYVCIYIYIYIIPIYIYVQLDV